ncbi:MAG: methionyl-tRNA formyltransferase [Candidatus Saccharimonas sp.]
MTPTSKTTTLSGKTSLPIIFFGSEAFSLYSLRALVEAGFDIVAVVTKPDTQRGRGHMLTEPAVKQYAKQRGLTVWQPTSLHELLPLIEPLKPIAGVLVSYGRIIPESLLDACSPGIINLHPSLLPKYRGPSPIESAIANRDNKTGVTLMKLVKAMDAGPIYAQFPYALDGTETRPELYKTLGTLGAHVLVTTLPDILSGNLTSTDQKSDDVSYCSLLTRKDTYLDFSQLTPGEAEARIRAHLEFPRTRVKVGSHDLIILKAHGVMSKKTPLDIKCSNGAFLSLDLLIAPSGHTMTADEFLRGYRVE